MDKGFFVSGEVNDCLPREIFSPEDVFDYLSESDIDTVETIEEKVGSRKEENIDAGGVDKSLSETTGNIIWAYLKDIGHVSLLTSDEECRIAKKIEEGDEKAKKSCLSKIKKITKDTKRYSTKTVTTVER
jgi:RNA polymerase primary sigma factor